MLTCYGWSVVTPQRFSTYDPPTCSGDEQEEHRVHARAERDPSLPTMTTLFNKTKATYSWDNPAEKKMRQQGVDFRPPSVDQSWSWVLNTSQFGSDGQWLPDARKLSSDVTTVKLARQILAGFHAIQKALVMHRDHSRHNLLVTKEGRLVWVDFDRARVLAKLAGHALADLKMDLIEVHGLLFGSFYEVHTNTLNTVAWILIKYSCLHPHPSANILETPSRVSARSSHV